MGVYQLLPSLVGWLGEVSPQEDFEDGQVVWWDISNAIHTCLTRWFEDVMVRDDFNSFAVEFSVVVRQWKNAGKGDVKLFAVADGRRLLAKGVNKSRSEDRSKYPEEVRKHIYIQGSVPYGPGEISKL